MGVLLQFPTERVRPSLLTRSQRRLPPGIGREEHEHTLRFLRRLVKDELRDQLIDYTRNQLLIAGAGIPVFYIEYYHSLGGDIKPVILAAKQRIAETTDKEYTRNLVRTLLFIDKLYPESVDWQGLESQREEFRLDPLRGRECYSYYTHGLSTDPDRFVTPRNIAGV
ncbi:hypothetical protein J4450_03795 [Candidatus Micrarchaeota archaeon]|nr:hypothetical protein [Candidatus Micrarchaeota archaeon]